MEKLIELLNEYTNHWPLYIRHSHNYEGIYAQVQEDFTVDITSKKFWFIQWLVENEKIDWEKFQEPKIRGTIWLISNWHNSEWKSYKDYSKELDYESLLMLLSIQDEPIEFLISILK